MGGRGSASGKNTTPKSVSKARDLAGLDSYMQKHYSMKVDTASLSGSDFETVKNSVAGIEDVIKEFPQAANAFTLLRGADLGESTYANASFFGQIQLGEYMYQNRERLNRFYNEDVQAGWHPKGTDLDGVAVHEAGHVLEAAIIQKYNMTRTAMAQAWNEHTFAKKIVDEAFKSTKKLPGMSRAKKTDTINSLSQYAGSRKKTGTRDAETIAESVADYQRNRDNAHPLSKEIWKILKRELG